MGKKAQEIVKADLSEIINDLIIAYCDEWLAHYQYWVTARTITGIDADTLIPILEKQSADELHHAGEIAERIRQLGGRLVSDPSSLVKNSGCGYKQPPDEPTDLKRVIEDVLAAEGCAIDFYSKMVEKYHSTDTVTHELFEDLLKDEVEDEEEWERFLSGL